jgi:hypothetical protein
VLVYGRHLAYEAGNDKLARLLDDAGYLPLLLQQDGPVAVRAHLAGRPEDAAYRMAVAMFDEELAEVATQTEGSSAVGSAPRQVSVEALAPGALYVALPSPTHEGHLPTIVLSHLLRYHGAMIAFDLDANRELKGFEILAGESTDDSYDEDRLAVQLTMGPLQRGVSPPDVGSGPWTQGIWKVGSRTAQFTIRASSQGGVYVATSSRAGDARQQTVYLSTLVEYRGPVVAFDLDANHRLLGVTIRFEHAVAPSDPDAAFELTLGASR